jgi:hypothetical protein
MLWFECFAMRSKYFRKKNKFYKPVKKWIINFMDTNEEKKEEKKEEKEKRVVVFETSLDYSLRDKNGNDEETGKAVVQLDEKALSLFPKFNEAIISSFRDIIQISESDYRISLNLPSKKKLILFNIGYQYENFLRIFSRLRNEIILKDILVSGTPKKSGIKGEFFYFNESGQESAKGKCEIRLYATALVIMPEKGEFIRISYGDLSEIKEEDYRITLLTDFNEKIIISKIGENFSPLAKAFSERMNKLSLKMQSLLKDMLPNADPLLIREIARVLKEGRAVQKQIIDSISPDIWPELEKKLEEMGGIKEEYNFLKSLGQKEKISIGLKRGLMGDLTGEYVWFLIPIYSTNPKERGNVIAMEAGTGAQGGRATYFFRIFPREEYRNLKEIKIMHQGTDKLIKKINRAMVEINFRREPIYLSDEKLEEPGYAKYKFAVQKMTALRTLRLLFIGRVIHTSPEQWTEDVNGLLDFNITSKNDSDKWIKGE